MAMVSAQHWAVLEATQSSGSQIFVDLSSAFASIMRQLAFSEDRSDEYIKWLTHSFGMPNETFEDILKNCFFLRRLGFILVGTIGLDTVPFVDHVILFLKSLHNVQVTWFLIAEN